MKLNFILDWLFLRLFKILYWEYLNTQPERAQKAGITEAYFDRGGFLFHGRVKAVADAAREAGLKI